MIIREGTYKDTGAIISVLKASLGEAKLPKSEEIWNFKHYQNPFGKSLILLAEEDNKIIGVRAFMKWKWKLGEKVYSAYRAVDTATHPDHQGKGVFKKLTLEAINISTKVGDHFIFNTPNSQSLPGYMKMDWKKVSKLKIHLNLISPLKMFISDTNYKYSIQKMGDENVLENLIETHNIGNSRTSNLFTIKSIEYLKWRYENNPLQKYDVKCDHDFYLATYIKQHKYFNELRVVEQIYKGDKGLKKLNRALENLTKYMKVHIISCSENLGGLIGFSGAMGPMLTVRNLNLDIDNQLLNIDNWNYTLGDLELF
ncbi:GNAT family N-acetyltransferase [Gillisia sp. M10.2A]|uniref:GNAT family N-acetyltransferase n=1 Tax=Gillisia lutea TaxID=2909668 RepID=A0ABS9EMD5_9FLAO|nr:GNAT family N-acetyltransferase [Gillisia lutea]MCF4102663.1 GNAT family N-acetyltransferase [Gillisia lutea]